MKPLKEKLDLLTLATIKPSLIRRRRGVSRIYLVFQGLGHVFILATGRTPFNIVTGREFNRIGVVDELEYNQLGGLSQSSPPGERSGKEINQFSALGFTLHLYIQNKDFR